MALLFGRDRTVISRHIRNAYKEEEVDENITCAKFAHMGTDGLAGEPVVAKIAISKKYGRIEGLVQMQEQTSVGIR